MERLKIEKTLKERLLLVLITFYVTYLIITYAPIGCQLVNARPFLVMGG